MKGNIIGLALLASVLIEGVQAQAAVLVFDGFDTSRSADAVNGIYKHDLGVTGTAPVGGGIVGFEASRAWTMAPASGYPRGYENQLLLIATDDTTSRIGSRQLSAGLMDGKTVAYGRVDFRLDGIDNGGTTKIGFTTETARSIIGATVRIIWDRASSEWDLQVIYNTGSSIAVGHVIDDITLNTNYAVIWRMDDTADTLKVWVNPSSVHDAASVTFSDYGGSVSNIEDAYFQYNAIKGNTRAREGVFYDNLTLGDAMEDVMPKPAIDG